MLESLAQQPNLCLSRFDSFFSAAKIRAAWYVLMCALEDEDAQRNGIVNVYGMIGANASDPQIREVMKHSILVDEALPYRSNATHLCYNSVALRPLLQLLQFVAGKENRIRFRTHFGMSPER